MVARSVAWPLPVKASEPCSDAFRPLGWKGELRRRSRNRAPATIGPIVCDEEGPTPTLNMSNTERNMGCLSGDRPGRGGGTVGAGQ